MDNKPKPLTEKPLPPAPAECCENGCEPCVWDLYREALSEWKSQQATASIPPKPDDSSQ